MKKLSSIILSGLAPITILSTASLATSCNSKQLDEPLIHDTNVFFHTPAIADTITVIDLSKFDTSIQDDINTTFQSLEGLIVQLKGKAEIFVLSGVKERDSWFYDMRYKYRFDVNVVDNIEPNEENNVWDVLGSYKELFNSKYIEYRKANLIDDDPDKDNISINNATMVSACDHYLMASNKLLEFDGGKYKNILENTLGISKHDDASTDAIGTFNEYMDQGRTSHLDNYMLLNQSPVDFALRDYAIAAKIPTICVGLLSDDDPSTSQREIVAKAMKPNSPIFGWSHGFDGTISDCGPEQDYLIWSTTHKFNVLASDHCYNLSFYSYDKPTTTYKQRKHKKIKADPKKHYVAIVMSDGDNIQWMQNDFLTSDQYWGSDHRGTFPLSWTISPTPIDLNNSILEKLYTQATDNDEIIAGPSGYSYINPAWYYQPELMDSYNEFAQRTAGYMHDCDLSVANVLDYKYPGYDPVDPQPTDPKCMTPFMKQDQIKGLVWSLDGLSLDGHGSVSWINDKPLLSFREGIWDNDYLHTDKVIERLKSYPRNIHKIDGYTALVVNVWAEQGKMEHLAKEFVAKLPKDVQLVTISQLLQLISDNVEHKDAAPADYPHPTKK